MAIDNIYLSRQDRIVSKVTKYFPTWMSPNHITFIRFLCLIPLIYFLYYEKYILFLFIFIFAYITDALDGTLARSRKQTSTSGVYLDPIVDKLLFFIAFIFLAYGKINDTLFFVLLVAEITLMVLSWIYIPLLRFLKIKFRMASNVFGKFKNFCEIIAIIFLIINLFWTEIWLLNASQIFLLLALMFLILNFAKHVFIDAKFHYLR